MWRNQNERITQVFHRQRPQVQPDDGSADAEVRLLQDVQEATQAWSASSETTQAVLDKVNEEQQLVPHWPQYPQGLRVTTPSHSRLLFKAIKTAGKIAQRKIKVPHARKGLIAKDEVAIKHGGPRFW